MESAEKIAWNQWNPGLDNDNLTLGEVKETLPGADPTDISLLVRLLENPKSPVALTGAATLERHDCIHIVIGRGLLPQDEAFVAGFTMGTGKDELKEYETLIFKVVSRFLYPSIYRYTAKHLLAYELGLEAGRNSDCHKIYEFPLEEHYGETLGKIRKELGIDTGYLKSIYRREAELLPGTKATKRLPV